MIAAPRWTLALVMLAVLSFVLALSAGAHEAFLAGAQWLEREAKSAGALAFLVFVVLAIASSLLSPVSSAPLVPSAVLAWGRGTTLVLLLAGWMIGALVAWWLGRMGRVRWLSGSKRVRAVEERMRLLPARRTFAAALLLRVALPSEVGYAYGIVRFPLGSYLVLTLLAEVPSALLLVFVSDALLQRRAGLVLAGVAIVASAIVLLLAPIPAARGRRLRA